MGRQFRETVIYRIEDGMVVATISSQDYLRYFVRSAGRWQELDESLFSAMLDTTDNLPGIYSGEIIEGWLCELGDGRFRVERSGTTPTIAVFKCPDGIAPREFLLSLPWDS